MSDIVMLDCFAGSIKAACTTRQGGISKAPYDSFNLALHVGDDEKSVMYNRSELKSRLNLKAVCYMDQVHGSDVVYVKNDSIVYSADAIVTDKKDLGLAVMTADCLSVLLGADNEKCVAAVHCGWRSACSGIIKNTVAMMQKLGADSIRAFMGPCIGYDSFEVGSEVRDAFVALDMEHGKSFRLNDNNRYMCNLRAICATELRKLGIVNIHDMPADTFKNTDRFYSYRKEKITGRMASIIAL